MKMVRAVVGMCVSGLLAIAVSACGGSKYHLPPPPPADEQRDVAANPAEQAEQERSRYLEARASLLKLYEFLSNERFEEAEQLLSQQTRDFLSYGNETGDPSMTLSSGTLALPNGRSVEFEPVDLLIGGKVQSIADSVEGIEEHETQNRREIFVVDPDGESHKVVMISEGGRWVLHRTSVNPGQE